jgi:sugar phosphate isomerase/epimerase
MKSTSSRRKFIQQLGLAPLATMASYPLLAGGSQSPGVYPPFPAKLRLSLNCYSFNAPLRAGSIDLFDVLKFCAEYDIDAIDPTGYYFPGYPEVPDNAYISRFKQQAFRLGIDISGTGVRNDFTLADPEKRKHEVTLVKKWIEAAASMGAPTLRIFIGVSKPESEGYTKDQVFEWMAADIAECCDYAGKYGVVLGLQNHWDYIRTSDDIIRIFKMVNSPWLGLNLDIGSFRADPYEEIRKTIHLAVTWQIKENVYINEAQQKTDYRKLFKIIQESGYRGYIPLETLGPGDPYEKLPVMIGEVRKALDEIAVSGS